MFDSDPLAGKTFGNYEILGELGHGGMGIVYKANDKTAQRVVALKILAPEFAEDPLFAERFEPEAQAAANITHPNIITIYAVGRHDDALFIAREYVDGQTLSALERERGRFEPLEALRIVRQVSAALSEAHAEGIVHRDIKPQNIMVDTAGHVEVLDFVMARLREGHAGGLPAMGTPLYMSPEQAQDQPVDGRGDIFSLGVVLYEMLAGHPPFQGDNPAALAYQIVYKPLPELPGDTTPAIVQLLNKMTAKNPDDRYPSAAALNEALDGLLS
jgi:eukaryotic-like serine/threonine-protein kinase